MAPSGTLSQNFSGMHPSRHALWFRGPGYILFVGRPSAFMKVPQSARAIMDPVMFKSLLRQTVDEPGEKTRLSTGYEQLILGYSYRSVDLEYAIENLSRAL